MKNFWKIDINTYEIHSHCSVSVNLTYLDNNSTLNYNKKFNELLFQNWNFYQAAPNVGHIDTCTEMFDT